MVFCSSSVVFCSSEVFCFLGGGVGRTMRLLVWFELVSGSCLDRVLEVDDALLVILEFREGEILLDFAPDELGGGGISGVTPLKAHLEPCLSMST